MRVRLLVDDLYTQRSDPLLRDLAAFPNVEVRLFNPFCCNRGSGPGGRYTASIFDFGLYFYHNAKTLIRNGTGPYFYLPKLENREEARLWNDVFLAAQNALGISRGTIRATVLI